MCAAKRKSYCELEIDWVFCSCKRIIRLLSGLKPANICRSRFLQYKMIWQIQWHLVSVFSLWTCSAGFYGCTCQLGFGCIPFLATSAPLVWWASSFSTCQWWPCSMCWGTCSMAMSGVRNKLTSGDKGSHVYLLISLFDRLPLLSLIEKNMNKMSLEEK